MKYLFSTSLTIAFFFVFLSSKGQGAWNSYDTSVTTNYMFPIDNYIYMLKDASMWQYKSGGKSWVAKANFPGNIGTDKFFMTIGRKAYVGGGSNTNEFWCYNPDSNSWTRKADFIGPMRAYALGMSAVGKGFVTRGMVSTSSSGNCSSFPRRTYSINRTDCFSDFYRFNPDSNRWSIISSGFGGAAYGCTGFEINGKLYFGFGNSLSYYRYSSGCSSTTETRSEYFLGSWYCYNPDSNTFTNKASLSFNSGSGYYGRYNALGFSINGKGFVGGGQYGVSTNQFCYPLCYYSYYSISDGNMYDPVTNTWYLTGAFPSSGNNGIAVSGYGYQLSGKNMYRLSNTGNVLTVDSVLNFSGCPNDSFKIYYKARGSYDTSNYFYVDISSDNFSTYGNSFLVGSRKSTDSSGYITCKIIGDKYNYNKFSFNNFTFRIRSESAQSFGIIRPDLYMVRPIPGTIISVNNSGQCLNTNSFNFTNSTSGSLSSVLWNFGGGSTDTSSQNNPVKIYNSTGQRWVTLTTKLSTSGCSSSDYMYVNVYPNATMNLSASTNNFCGDSLRIDAASGLNTYRWSNGDTLSYTYAKTTGWYKLTAKNSNGCSGTDSIYITINPKPQPNAGSDLIICQGASVNIGQAAVSGHSYRWTSVNGYTSTNSNPSITPSNTDTYILFDSVNATGCINRDTVAVFVNALPTPNAGTDQTVCQGTSVNIGQAAVSGHSYRWTATNGYNSSTSNPIITPTSSATYILVDSINTTGCINTDTVIISVNSLPTPNAGADQSVCQGNSVYIGQSAVTGHSYNWSASNGYTSTNPNPNVSPAATATYILKDSVNATGCVNRDTITITVNPKPAASVGTSSSLCSGGSIQIGSSAVSGNTYSWTSNPSGYTSTSANPTVSPTTTTKYILTETITATGCSKMDSVTITVNPLPTASVGSNSSICSGGSIQIGSSAVSGNTYSWTSNPSGYTSTSANPTVSPTTTTKYILTETITATGCSKMDSVTITVNPLPTASVGSNSSICSGGSIQIGSSAVSGNTYSWTSNPSGYTSTSANPTVSPTTTTKYILTETITATGCSKMDSVTITVNPKPTASVGSSNSICSGGSIQIGSSAVSGNTYSWTSNPSGYTSTSANPTVSPTTTTKYILTETITATGCSKMDSVTITVNPLPTASVGSSSSICSGGSIQIGSSAVSGNTYSWTSNPSGYTSTSANPTVSPTTTTKYILTETITATGCSKMDSVTITVNPLPTPNAGADQSICAGSSVNIGQSAVTGHSYNWSASNGYTSTNANPSVSPAATATYILKDSVNATGCINSDTVVITVKPAAVGGTVSVSKMFVCSGQLVNLKLTGYVGSIQWQRNTGSGWVNFGAVGQDTLNNLAVSVTTQFRAAVDLTGCSTAYSNTVNVTSVSGMNVWAAPNIANWSSRAFWCGGIVPVSGTNVSIHSNIIITSAASCNNMIINAGDTVFVFAGGNLTINGDLTINGALVMTAGTITFTKAGTCIPSATYHQLRVCAAGTVYACGNMTVNNNLIICSGTTFNDTGYTITVKANIDNNGTHVSQNSGKLNLNSSAFTYTLTGTGTYGNIDMTAAGLRLGTSTILSTPVTANTTVTGILNMNQGSISLNNSVLTIGSASSASGQLNNAGNGLILGASGSGLTLLGSSGSSAISNVRLSNVENVTINRPNGVSLGAGSNILGTLSLVSGKLNQNGYNLVIGNTGIATGAVSYTSGYFSNSASSGYLYLNGNSSAGVYTLKADTLNGFGMFNPNGATLGTNVYIRTGATLSSGDMNLNGNTMTLSSTAFISETAGQNFKGNGKIRTTRNFSTALNNNNIAGMGLLLSTGSATGTTTIVRGHVVQTNSGKSSIARYYDVTVQNAVTATKMELNYDSTELNGNVRGRLRINTTTNGGATWSSITGCSPTVVNSATGLVGKYTGVSLSGSARYTASDSLNSLSPVFENTTVESHENINGKISTWPNPFNSSFTAELDIAAGNYQVTLMDMNGRVIESKQVEVQTGKVQLNVSGEGLSSGVYLLNIQGNGSTTNLKVVKQ